MSRADDVEALRDQLRAASERHRREHGLEGEGRSISSAEAEEELAYRQQDRDRRRW